MAGGQLAPGEISALGMAKETTFKTYVNPTNWLGWITNGISATDTEVASRDVALGTVNTQRINKVNGITIAGPLTWTLGASHGALLFLPTFGANTSTAALTADTVKAATPVTTTAGISTITLTNTGAVTYVVGAWVQVNTGVSAELRQILTIATNGAPSTVLTVGALIINAAAAAGTAVTQIAQIKFTTAPTSATLPSLSMEVNEGGAFSAKLAGVQVDSFSLAADANDVQCTANVVGSAAPVKLTTPTTPAPSAAELADFGAIFTMENCQAVVYADPLQFFGGSTATMAQGETDLITSVRLNLGNNLKRYRVTNLAKVGKYGRGKLLLTGSYSFLQESGRYAEFDDYINSTANPTVPLAFGWSNNQSNTSTAAPRGVGFYIPAARLTKPTYTRAIGDVTMATVDFVVESNTATGDAFTTWVADGTGTAY